MLQFQRASKQSHWFNMKGGTNDGIFLQDYSRDGSCFWGLLIASEFIAGSKVIKVEILSDALMALRNRKVVKILQTLEGLKYLDDVERVLESFGVKGIIE